MKNLTQFITPQLKKVHSGKVRESLQIDQKTRIIVATDRISCFDKVLKTSIPHKGAVLNGLSCAWMDKTRHIVDNHLIKMVDPNISLVKEAHPIRIEMIVRKFMTGSIWREYSKGKRVFSGVKLPDSLKKNDPFPELIVTPTTKGVKDEEISPEDIVNQGIVGKDLYEEMSKLSRELFSFGYELCASKNLILVDSKYEFGMCGDDLILIDEIHTPDSSRFWCAEHYDKDPSEEFSMDKEYMRQWILRQEDPKDVCSLPENIVEEASKRYLRVYEALLGEKFSLDSKYMSERMYKNLRAASLIKDAYVAIVMGSKKDFSHAEKIKELLESYDVMVDMRVLSAHKNGERISSFSEEYNRSIDPGAVIAVAGMSNGLGGALAANLVLPVINCPPSKDNSDIILNLHSSLMMPSKTPASTCIGIENAVQMALRSLNLQRLRSLFLEDIQEMKRELKENDFDLREKTRKCVQV